MITKIKTKNFLGPDITEKCSNKMFFSGPNRSGKTTRTNAIHLCLNGFIASAHRVCKKPSDILEQYAENDKLTCSIEIDDKTEFEYHISKDSKGKVSKRLRVDKKKYSEKEYMQELALSGNPKIIDLSTFIQLSDDKKIDQIFKLYPGDVDIKELNSDISKKTAERDKKQADIKMKESVIKENTKSKGLIELPAGSLSQTKADIEDHIIAYRGTRDKIAGMKAKEQEPSPISESNATFSQDAPLPAGTFPIQGEKSDHIHTSDSYERKTAGLWPKKDYIASLENILQVMSNTDCQMCAASMVIKKAIKEMKNA